MQPIADSTPEATPAPLAYESECHHLRACGELMRLPPLAIATGLVFLHRFRRACPQPEGITGSVSTISVQCLFPPACI